MTYITVGIVKWFNNKVGYGFITELEGDKREIFVHYSAIQVNKSQYKYLVQGEYVEFNLVKSTNDNHEWQAMNVSGIKTGPTMCETRWVSRSMENNEDENIEENVSKSERRSRPLPRRRVSTDVNKDEFTTVEKKKRVSSKNN
jgi:CspA family cold shock protein